MRVVISVNRICFVYGDRPVLQDVSLQVEAGEILGLVGADGAGKSTLLQLLVGQLTPASGTLRVLDHQPGDPALRNNLAYMPQGFGLYTDLSIAENLGFFADLHGMPRDLANEKIADLLTRTGLTGFEERRAGQLSGGMMQKLALACALVTEPRVMFLDEPTTGVDPVSRRAFWRLLEAVREEGVAILYATANMDEAERCDRVAMLQRGRLTHQGTPLELINTGGGTLVAVNGEGVRRHREALRELNEARFVFPVGTRLNVWLYPGITLDVFRKALSERFDGLTAQQLKPTLHDAAVRDLALGAGADYGG